MRIYPAWDKPTSKAALQSQHWQLAYFFEVSEISSLLKDRILALYF